MTATMLKRTAHTADPTTTANTCQVYAGSLLAPCQNPGTRTVVLSGAERQVCPAHA